MRKIVILCVFFFGNCSTEILFENRFDWKYKILSFVFFVGIQYNPNVCVYKQIGICCRVRNKRFIMIVNPCRLPNERLKIQNVWRGLSYFSRICWCRTGFLLLCVLCVCVCHSKINDMLLLFRCHCYRGNNWLPAQINRRI